MELSAVSPGPSWLPVWLLLMMAAVLLSLGVIVRIARPQGRWGLRLRRRFVLGVPWGTVITVVGVILVYLFVQGGVSGLRDPLVVPFRSWSLTYPLGAATAAFSHAGLGHVSSNLIATLVFAPLVEYAWGHFPTERGSQSFGRYRNNPVVRILAFPACVAAVGLVTSLFAVGPVIGFSGVVFAFGGFALVFYPIGTIVALSGGEVLRLLYNAVRNPVSIARPGPRFVTPWWADIAIQGHLLGLLLGVLLGAYMARERGHRPGAGRLWLAVLIFGIAESLWALYWFRGGNQYVLFRAGGVIAVCFLATLLTAVITTDRGRVLVDSVGLPLTGRHLPVDLQSRELALILFGALLLGVAVPAVPANLVTVTDDPYDDGVSVRDYTVTYAENVPDQYVSAFDVSLFGETTQVNTSGVVVVSERRNAFQTVIPQSQLNFQGQSSVTVGGLGWRREVGIDRVGWRAAGNSSVYKVYLDPPDADRRLVFTSSHTTVSPRVNDRRIRIRPTEEDFEFIVLRDGRWLGSVPVPEPETNVSAGGISFNRTGRLVYAERNGTKIRIARRGGK